MQPTRVPHVPSDKKQAGIRISEDLLLKLRLIARDRGATLNELFEEGMMEWYERQPERATLGAADPSKPVKTGRPIKIEGDS